MEVVGHGRARQLASGERGKHQAGVLPAMAEQEAAFRLLDPVRPQRFYGDGRQRQCPPAAVGFQLREDVHAALPLKLALHPHGARVQIDVVPREAQQLALPHAGCQGKRDETF